MDWEPLVQAARNVRDRAYAPYSGFLVGAALQMKGGEIYSGCNIENRSFGGTVCAERVAVGTAVAAGSQEIEAIVVISETSPPAAPCGLCLQVLTEFGGPHVPVLLINPDGERQELRLADLHPHPFVIPPQGLGRLPG
jgi:homotetrameric cytidine deaminase